VLPTRTAKNQVLFVEAVVAVEREQSSCLLPHSSDFINQDNEKENQNQSPPTPNVFHPQSLSCLALLRFE
jgi:hypothetical protein